MEEAGELIRACSKVFRHGAKKSDIETFQRSYREEGLSMT